MFQLKWKVWQFLSAVVSIWKLHGWKVLKILLGVVYNIRVNFKVLWNGPSHMKGNFTKIWKSQLKFILNHFHEKKYVSFFFYHTVGNKFNWISAPFSTEEDPGSVIPKHYRRVEIKYSKLGV